MCIGVRALFHLHWKDRVSWALESCLISFYFFMFLYFAFLQDCFLCRRWASWDGALTLFSLLYSILSFVSPFQQSCPTSFPSVEFLFMLLSFHSFSCFLNFQNIFQSYFMCVCVCFKIYLIIYIVELQREGGMNFPSLDSLPSCL